MSYTRIKLIGRRDQPFVVPENEYLALEARCRELEAALLDLYSGTAEYVYLNHLGDPHNTTPMRNAAKALGAPALEAYDRLRALTASETGEKPK